MPSRAMRALAGTKPKSSKSLKNDASILIPIPKDLLKAIEIVAFNHRLPVEKVARASLLLGFEAVLDEAWDIEDE